MKRLHTDRSSGFTIVELLIVIVVIAVLARITIVAYNGLQSRAQDTALKADFNAFAKQMEYERSFNGGGNTFPTTLTSALGIKFTRSIYGADAQGRNLCYCVTNTGDNYVLVGVTKSGNYFYTSPTTGLQSTPPISGWGDCALLGPAYIFTNPQFDGYSSGAWTAWVN